MSEVVESGKVRWFVAGFGAVGIMAALLMLFRAPIPPAPVAAPVLSDQKRATVMVAKLDDSNRLLREEAELRDMRPLFLPTDKNASLPEPKIESGRTFLDNETLTLTVSDAEAQLSKDLPPLAQIAGKNVDEARSIDALNTAENPISLQGFGRGKPEIRAMPLRAGFVEVVELKGGTRVWSEDLPASGRPPGEKAWSPVEFVATIDSIGLVGELIVLEGSRVEEIDAYFKNYLARVWRVGERFAPGFYRITVSP